jgi:predicted Zn-dependent peptidase
MVSHTCIKIAFHPKFLASRVEKERRAILSELQMMNTIEYRVDCQVWSKDIFVFRWLIFSPWWSIS